MQIKPINGNVECALETIREAYLTVARDFNITRENGPTNPAFIEAKHLREMDEKGIEMYGAFNGSKCIGFVALEDAGQGLFYLEKLAVMPSQRHKGYGLILMDFVFDRVRALSGKEVSIGIINENTVLKNWYVEYGFIEKEVKHFAHLPFTVCLLRKKA